MPLTLLQAPTELCVSLDEAKLHLRVDLADDDDAIERMIAAATDDAEHLMQRAVLLQTWRLTLDAFAPVIALQRPTVVSVDAFKYYELASGQLVDLPTSAYLADLDSPLVARITPAYGASWPAAQPRVGAVRVDFTCGWQNAENVPAAIKQWVLLRVGAYYANREAWTAGKAIEPNPFIDLMLDRFRIFTV